MVQLNALGVGPSPGSWDVRVLVNDGSGGFATSQATLNVLVWLPGDANGDNLVDGGDYTIWADNYSQPDLFGPQYGDFNYDGSADGGDYTIWADNFAPAPVPASLPGETWPDGSVTANQRQLFETDWSLAHATSRVTARWTVPTTRFGRIATCSRLRRRSYQ